MASSGSISLRDLENHSTIITMTVFLRLKQWSVMKPIVRWDHGQAGVGMGFPAGRVRGTLDMTQVKHDGTYFLMPASILGHQYLVWRSEYVRWVPG